MNKLTSRGTKISPAHFRQYEGTIDRLAKRESMTSSHHRSVYFSSSPQSEKKYEDINVEALDSSDLDSSSRWSEMFRSNIPVIIKGLVNNWPAVSDEHYKWITGKRFQEVDKECFVPVEIGRNYMDGSLSIAHMEFSEIAAYLLEEEEVNMNYRNQSKNQNQNQNKNEKKIEIENNLKSDKHQPKIDLRSLNSGNGTIKGNGKANRNPKVEMNQYMSRTFLAQYALSEIPTLEDDVKPFPDIIKTGKGHLYRSNIWIGGAEGSESPCHRDPFHNILCQVYGEKTVLLFSPSDEVNLYPAVGTVQKNTSLVDISSPDYEKHPLFREAKGFSGILRAGDGIYIPKGFFHYCATTSKSCSVNFWWL